MDITMETARAAAIVGIIGAITMTIGMITTDRQTEEFGWMLVAVAVVLFCISLIVCFVES